jgi:hypothetical protein
VPLHAVPFSGVMSSVCELVMPLPALDRHALDETACKYAAEMWGMVTVPGTNKQAELERYAADPDAYRPPIKPWLLKYAGRDVILRTRVPGRAPSLYRDMLSLYDANLLALKPDSEDLDDDTCDMLLRSFAVSDPTGPWGELCEMPDRKKQLRALMACLLCVAVYLPSVLLRELKIQVGRQVNMVVLLTIHTTGLQLSSRDIRHI